MFRWILLTQAAALIGCLYEGLHRPNGSHIGASNAMFGLTAANIADFAINFKEWGNNMYRFVLRMIGLVCSVLIMISGIVQFILDEVSFEPSNIS